MLAKFKTVWIVLLSSGVVVGLVIAGLGYEKRTHKKGKYYDPE